MKYDVIVVGAGPGGSSAATFLAQAGYTVLLLDKSEFPRDKVCGDGLTPQALYWLDVLGCIDEVLSQTATCITAADLFINGEYAITAGFPQDTPYPAFGTCLERKKLDSLLVKHAVSRGAIFKPGHRVRALSAQSDGICVEAETSRGTVRFHGTLLIGADGAGSIVSRYLGNKTKGDTAALSMRAYYDNVRPEMSPFKLFFSERYFPGYGWICSDERGFANVGFGYIHGRSFAMKRTIRSLFDEFVRSDGCRLLEEATRREPPAGWWESLSKPARMSGERVMLVGDAGNCADPMNGAGIHKAIESAWLAAHTAMQAFHGGDFSQPSLSLYQKLWDERDAPDRAVSELFISAVKNPNLKGLYFLLLRSLARMSTADPRLQDFCCGVFSGLIPQRSCLSIGQLWNAVPCNPQAWISALGVSSESTPQTLIGGAWSILQDAFNLTSRVASSPSANLAWAVDVLTKALNCSVLRASEASSFNSWTRDSHAVL